MIVLEWRPLGERWLAGASTAEAGGWAARLVAPLVDRLTRRRVAQRQLPPADRLVVSVGNLRVGGTGKTPVVEQLARDLAERGIVGGVVTRGYRAPDRGARVVEPGDRRAGDEAQQLAEALTPCGWGVVQARHRDRGLDILQRALPRARVVLLEDAHQSGRIGRHCDVLILDRWREQDGRIVPLAGDVLPLGPYRESAAGAQRADIWLLETPSLRATAGSVAVAAFRRESRLDDPDGLVAAGRRLGLVCGLARPEGFEQACVDLLPHPPRIAVRLPDHARYDRRLRARLREAEQRHGIEAWVTTAKDVVKMDDRWPGPGRGIVVRQQVIWTTTPTLPELIEERLAAIPCG